MNPPLIFEDGTVLSVYDNLDEAFPPIIPCHPATQLPSDEGVTSESTQEANPQPTQKHV
jgi:hypothetical protein